MNFVIAFALCGLALPCFSQDKPANKKDDRIPPISPDRPDLTNGPGITPLGKFVIENGYRQTRSGRSTLHEWGDGPTVRYGLTPRFEARVVVPTYAVQNGSEGWEDTNIGFKWLLRDGGDGGGFKRPSFAFQGGTSLPTGTGAFRSKAALPYAIGIVDWDLASCGDLGGNLGIGDQLNDAGRRFVLLTTSLSYNHTLGGPWVSYFEGYMTIPSGSGNGSAEHFCDGGLQYLLSNDCMLDASLGTQIDRHRQNAYFDLGVSVRF